MATLQTVFDACELLDRELALQSTEADVARGIIAYNFAKDYFDALMSQHPKTQWNSATAVTTTANQETTTINTTILRVDAAWFIDPSTSLPSYKLDPIYTAGDQSAPGNFELLRGSSSNKGRPVGYAFNGSSQIYWNPVPDATHTVRLYGYTAASDLTAAANSFPFPLIARPAFATFMTQLFQIGLGDPTADYEGLARQTFGPVIESMSRFQRTGASPATLRYGSY